MTNPGKNNTKNNSGKITEIPTSLFFSLLLFSRVFSLYSVISSCYGDVLFQHGITVSLQTKLALK